MGIPLTHNPDSARPPSIPTIDAKQPKLGVPHVDPIGTTGSFYNTQTGSPSDPAGTFANSDFYAITPRRSRWFNNILKSREKSNISNINSNGNNISDRNPNGNNIP